MTCRAGEVVLAAQAVIDAPFGSVEEYEARSELFDALLALYTNGAAS